MSSIPIYVGLDYHQDHVQVCVLDPRGKQLANARAANRWEAVRDAAAKHGSVQKAALEACTGAADLAQELADRAGWCVELGHPLYIQRMRRKADKSDYADGRMLADLSRVGWLPRVWLPPEGVRERRRLVGYRQHLVDQRRAAKLRVGALLREHRVAAGAPAGRWSKAWVAWLLSPGLLPPASLYVAQALLAELGWLKQRIAEAEAELGRATDGDPLVGFLRTLACVGPVTAWVIAAQVGDFSRFGSGKALARYCGLTPANASSGSRVADAGLVREACPLLRATLIELAHRLTRCEARWKQMKRDMKARGKASCLIAAAVANRWTRRLYHEVKDWREGRTLPGVR
jgi:transposase